MSREIPLTQGHVATVDKEDYIELMKYSWYAFWNGAQWYARTNIKNSEGKHRGILMHRFLLSAEKGDFVDHRNLDGRDNRRKNIRLCTQQQNTFNKKPRKNSSSRYKGVYWCKDKKRWKASASLSGKVYGLGSFKCEVAAARVYDRFAIEHHGDFVRLNFPQETT